MTKKNKILILSLVLSLICVAESALILLGCKADWALMLPWFLYSVFVLAWVATDGQMGIPVNNAAAEPAIHEGKNNKTKTKRTKKTKAADTDRKMTMIVPLHDYDKECLDLRMLTKNEELPLRVCNILRRRKITNLSDLEMYYSTEILSMAGMGKKSAANLRHVMRKYNIHFKAMPLLKDNYR